MVRIGLFAMLVACGDNLAAPIDAAIPIDAKTAIDIEVVHDDMSPAPGVDVVFQDKTGAVVVATKADANGKLRIDMMPAISMVTAMAMDPTTNAVSLATTMGIEPGDVLQLFLAGTQNSSTPTKIATLAASFPPNAPATTDTWKIDAICQSTSGASMFTANLDIYGDCQDSQQMLKVAAIASHGDTPLAFSTMTVQVAATGNTIVDFPDGWRTDFATFQQAITNAPAGTLGVRSVFSLEVGGDTWFPYATSVVATAVGAGSMQTYLYPPGFATGGEYGAEVIFSATSPTPVSLWHQITATMPASDSVDLSTTLLPAIDSTGVSATTTVRPKVVWTAAGTMQGATGGFVDLSWPKGDWGVLFPPNTVSPLQVPELPDALAAFRPPADGSVSSTPYVSFQSDSYDANYDAARQKHDTIPATYVWNSTSNSD